MSPRSEEFLAVARRNLGSARVQIDGGYAETAISTAYYAMLYAARAALSERDRNARSHTGTWQVFTETFVASGEFDAGLARAARATQARREAGDYAAAAFSLEEADELLATAERFVAAVARLIES